jgi:putative ABC transport system substrate-binding protein
VLLANGDPAIKAAQRATRTVPVIFIGSGDPVGDGLIQSLARPGGNLTGFAVMEPSLGAKLLGILKQVAPHPRCHLSESRQCQPQANYWPA